ncbi:hypothetical protein ACJJTC_010286 [Scirpophaga incertulas]
MSRATFNMNLSIVFCIVILLLSCKALAQNDDQDSRDVYIEQGPIRGYKDPNTNVFTFYGIPYASVPTGKHKYKAPLPPQSWITTFDAKDRGIICPQAQAEELPLFYAGKIIQEDCLIANIYTPDTTDTNLPVVVYIHGGAYQGGYGTMSGPTKLVELENIIAVTFNYRLGIHGFLCLGTEKVPGNAGLKDMIALLNSGSSSIELLLLTPAVRGLFSKIIPESGSSLAAFAVQNDPIAVAQEFAQRYNVTDVDDIDALEDFYTTTSLTTITSDLFRKRTDQTYLFAPCVESSNLPGGVLHDSPYNILISGNYKKVPIMYGFNNMEGLLRIGYLEEWSEAMNENFADFLPPDLQFHSDEEKADVADTIKQFYFGNSKIDNTTSLEYVAFFSDIMFIYPMVRASKLMVSTGHQKIFLYEYSFYDNNTTPVPFTDVRGSTHLSQTNAVLDEDESNLTDMYKAMKLFLRNTWGRFIATGIPSKDPSLPTWPRLKADETPYLSVGQKIMLKDTPPLADRMAFWDSIYDIYYKPPMPPN